MVQKNNLKILKRSGYFKNMSHNQIFEESTTTSADLFKVIMHDYLKNA